MNTPLAGRFTAWTDLLSAVEKNQGVYRVPMEALRQLEGAQRLGANVLTAIKQRLATLGFGSLPEELPNRQNEFIVIYRIGTPASDTIEAIKKGLSGGSAGETVYQALWQLNATPAPEEVVTVDQVSDTASTIQDAIQTLLQVTGGKETKPKEKTNPTPTPPPAPTSEPTPAKEFETKVESNGVPSGFSS